MINTCVVTYKYGQYKCGDIPSNSDKKKYSMVSTCVVTYISMVSTYMVTYKYGQYL